MKNILTCFLLLFITTKVIQGQCPNHYVAKIQVVDKDLKIIKNLKFMEISSTGDSTLLIPDAKDSTIYLFCIKNEEYCPNNDLPIRYTIEAPGYIFLRIKDIYFERRVLTVEGSTNPVLQIILRERKWVDEMGVSTMLLGCEYSVPLYIKDSVVYNYDPDYRSLVSFVPFNKYSSACSFDKSKDLPSENTSLVYSKLFPNPFANELSITLPSTIESTYSIEFYNSIGSKVMTSSLTHSLNTINTTDLKKGVYMVIIKDEFGFPIHNQKVIRM